MPGYRAPAPRFPQAPERYDSRNEAQFRSEVASTLIGAIQAPAIPPVIQVEASRSGTTGLVTITVLDEDLRVTAIEFNKREGGGAASGWVDTWDTETGDVAVDSALVRTEGISVPVGKESLCNWRLSWRDQSGAARTTGGVVTLVNV